MKSPIEIKFLERERIRAEEEKT